MRSHHEEVALPLGLDCVVADEDSGETQTCNEDKEQGVVEVFLQEVELKLRRHPDEEDVETVGQDLRGRL
jgi:hypothetical protein